MTTPSSEAARAEAMYRAMQAQDFHGDDRRASGYEWGFEAGWDAGAEWKGAQVAALHDAALAYHEAMEAYKANPHPAFEENVNAAAGDLFEAVYTYARAEARTLQEEGEGDGNG